MQEPKIISKKVASYFFLLYQPLRKHGAQVGAEAGGVEVSAGRAEQPGPTPT